MGIDYFNVDRLSTSLHGKKKISLISQSITTPWEGVYRWKQVNAGKKETGGRERTSEFPVMMQQLQLKLSGK
jgi:hypothetical protein